MCSLWLKNCCGPYLLPKVCPTHTATIFEVKSGTLWTVPQHVNNFFRLKKPRNHLYIMFGPQTLHLPIPVAARSKAWVCSRLLPGIVGSNPAGSINVLSFLSVVCCQLEVSASGWSLVQRSSIDCGVCEWSRSPAMGNHDMESGRSATGGKKIHLSYMHENLNLI